MASSFERHQRLMRFWRGAAASSAASTVSTNIPSESENEILARHHKFVMSHDDFAASQASWETRMAAKYYRRLFKEYALVDLSRYKEGKLGLRWRTQGEVIAAKGQFECGNITKGKPCAATSSLHSYELNFAYVEQGQQKQELVKVRVCSHCAAKLNYRRQHKRSGRNDDDDEGSARSSSKKQKHHGRSDNDKARDESEEKALRSELSASTSSEVLGDQRDANRGSGGEDTGESNNGSSGKAAEASAWSGEAPTAKTEGDEMDAYLSGLFL